MNILFLMTDQQSAESMSCVLGDRHLHTPHMDRLAESGVMFQQAYCPNPLCAPARASIFTGRFPHETGLQTNGQCPDPDRFACMGSYFRDAGYRTGYFGKWHLPFDPQSAESHGFQDIDNIAKANGADAATPALADRFLKRDDARPFLLVASFNNPHNICEWARRQHPLPDCEIGSPPAEPDCPPLRLNHPPPRDETDTIAFMRRSYQASATFPVSDFDERDWRQYVWAYYRMIESVDRSIGQVMQSLRDTGHADDTLVVLLSDHGDCQGAHRWNQKTVFYDESARVPLLFSGPGVAKGAQSSSLVNTGIDLLPTLLDIADIKPPSPTPGISLRPILQGKEHASPHDYVVCENHMVQGAELPNNDTTIAPPQGRMLRSKRYKYCIYNEGKHRESFIDMQTDPAEMHNLARENTHHDQLLEHRRLLQQHADTHADLVATQMLQSLNA